MTTIQEAKSHIRRQIDKLVEALDVLEALPVDSEPEQLPETGVATLNDVIAKPGRQVETEPQESESPEPEPDEAETGEAQTNWRSRLDADTIQAIKVCAEMPQQFRTEHLASRIEWGSNRCSNLLQRWKKRGWVTLDGGQWSRTEAFPDPT